MTIRSSLVAVGLAGLVATACLYGEHAIGQTRALPKADALVRLQEEKKGKDDKKEKNPHAIYYGVSSCNNKGCHGGDPPKTWIKDEENKEQLKLLATCEEADVVEKK